MIILLAVVLVVFTLVKTKIIHYSSLAYFPISFLAANFVYNSIKKRYRWQIWQSALLLFMGVVISIPIILVSVFDRFKEKIIASNLINDEFALANLRADGGWSGFEFLIGTLFMVAVVAVFYVFKRRRLFYRSIALWITTSLFMFFTLFSVVSKIEKYSQGALIDFFKSKANKDVYLKNLYFKSYATYFYGELKPPENRNYYDTNWLLKGYTDKDVYFVTKIHHAHQLDDYKDITKVGEKNGFVFFLRESKK
jgi:hypothetical protein